MSRQAVFNFSPDDSKQYTITKAEHGKLIIELSQNRIVLFYDMSNTWVNTDGCVEQYCCETSLYLLSMLTNAYNIIIYRSVGDPGHGRDVIDGLNDTHKIFISMLMTTVQLTGAEDYESQMEVHTSTENKDISLAREFQKHLSDPTWAYGLLDHGKGRKLASKQKWTDREYHVQ